MNAVEIRHAGVEDVEAVLGVYDAARRFMRSYGNNSQWVGGYPAVEDVLADVEAGNLYVGVDADGRVTMAFAFIIGDDPTYADIDGAWLNDEPYGTIHRIATDGRHSGMLKLCVDYCMRRVDNLRLDTHEVNYPMRNAAERLGFRPCGIIICRDGTPRIAYHKDKKC